MCIHIIQMQTFRFYGRFRFYLSVCLCTNNFTQHNNFYDCIALASELFQYTSNSLPGFYNNNRLNMYRQIKN